MVGGEVNASVNCTFVSTRLSPMTAGDLKAQSYAKTDWDDMLLGFQRSGINA